MLAALSQKEYKMTTRRDVLKAIPTVGTTFAISGSVLLDDAVAQVREAPVQPKSGAFEAVTGRPAIE